VHGSGEGSAEMNESMKVINWHKCNFLIGALSAFALAQDHNLDLIRSKVELWNECHNQHETSCFAGMYTQHVKIYGKMLSSEDAIQLKSELIEKHPDFKQGIDTLSINISTGYDGEYKAQFDKMATIHSKTRKYPSYLIFCVEGGEYRICEESDKITDKNLLAIKQKSKKPPVEPELATRDFRGRIDAINVVLEQMYRSKETYYVIIFVFLLIIILKRYFGKKSRLKYNSRNFNNGNAKTITNYQPKAKTSSKMFTPQITEDRSDEELNRKQGSKSKDFDPNSINENSPSRNPVPTDKKFNEAKIDKPKLQPPQRKLQFICSCCGNKSFSATGGSCRYSSSKTHIYIQENGTNKYICKYCGNKSFSALGGTCKYSPSSYHEFMNERVGDYICKFCGNKSFAAFGGNCHKSGHGHHEYL
jgi:hypothetical protein